MADGTTAASIIISQKGRHRLRASVVASLRLCATTRDLGRGIQMHQALKRRGLLAMCSDALITMYATCGALAEAKELFNFYKSKDLSTWTTLISACTEQGQAHNALSYFEEMQDNGLPLDAVVFACALKACGSMGALDKGEMLHNEIVSHGLLANNIVVNTALVDMYAKCKCIEKARQVLKGLPARNATSWNALIVGYSQQGQGAQALMCYEDMRREGISPDDVTFTSILKSCASAGALEQGESIHAEIFRAGLLESNISLCTALVDMYIRCGALTKAQSVLEELPYGNPKSWNALISRHAQEGRAKQALDCFEAMQNKGLIPDRVTYISSLKACSTAEAVDLGEEFHHQIIRQNLLRNDTILATALMDMYAKCGALIKAQNVHKELPFRDVVAWNALIAGFIHNNEGMHALKCYESMIQEGLPPNEVTFLCILKACGIVGAVDKGEMLHNEISKQGLLEMSVALGTAVVDMYAKCGKLSQARGVLEKLPVRNIFTWNALIAGFAQQGEAEQAMLCFGQLQDEGLSPDAVTLTCMLSLCTRLRLIEFAQIYFMNNMTNHYLKPDLKHFTCLINLFGSVGQLDEAIKMIDRLSSLESAVWLAVLDACLKWGDVNVGKWAFERLLQSDKTCAAAYVLMANIYACAGIEEMAEKVKMLQLVNQV